ncbi:TonB-dependent receptor, partial [Crocinitomicaceae bacterium]|nr:TonB-dependent receptor [Crocinitomicaceae bacterium]
MRWLLLLFLLISLNSNGQKIFGKVVDEEGPIEYASVRLFDKLDSTVIMGIYTAQDGTFKLDDVTSGTYFLKISFTNFSSYTLNPVILENSKDLDLGIVKLKISESLNLQEVIATGSLDVLKAGIDKKIYNVEDDLALKGGTVNDVLNNIPSIDIDQNGNISLRGDGNVTILIDGRPSGLVLGDGQNLLDALPANSIQRIEIVTNPSARYDPDGTSGIINIVMKKNKLKGFNGIVSSTYGAASLSAGQQFEANAALSYRNERFNLYTSYSYNQFRGFRNYSSILEQEITLDSSVVLEQMRTGTDFKEGGTFILGGDCFINKNQTVGFSGTFTDGFRERKGDLRNQLSDGNGISLQNWDRLSRDPRENSNLDLNLNY